MFFCVDAMDNLMLLLTSYIQIQSRLARASYVTFKPNSSFRTPGNQHQTLHSLAQNGK